MSVNKVILIGNLGRDPEVRYLDNQKVVASFPLATNEQYTDRQGNKIRQTEWHNIELWDNLAKNAEKHLKKGYTIFIEGKIRTQNWVDKEGISRSQKKIRGHHLNILSKERVKEDREPNTKDLEDLQSEGFTDSSILNFQDDSSQ
ncbi:MAG: single-stranded DNA-binding protein [Flavobacteriales bacterium]|nr:single-stranded DNA-binding protein [Flavobacteriales bacterium]